MRMKAKTIAIAVVGIALLAGLTGCEKPVNPNDLPVSHWADPKTIGADGFGYADGCSVASAQAILKSGLPFPNYGTKDELAADGKTINKRITTVDFWLGGTRFVFPAEIASSGSYPAHNPNRYNGLQGTLPHFYPKGEPAKVKDGMGAMVDVKFVCSMEPKFATSKGYQSNEDGIQKVIAMYEKELSDDRTYPGTVTVSIRKDLGMTEVLLDRDKETNNRRFWQASYFPLHRELKRLDGSVNGIGCQTRNDPEPQRRYGGRGWTCGTGFRINPNVIVTIDIYVSHLDQMPNIYDQVQQVIIDAKKAAE